MKKPLIAVSLFASALLAAALLVPAAVGPSGTGHVTVAWDANDPREQVSEYAIEFQAEGETDWTRVSAGTGTTMVLELPPTMHRIRAIAINAWGEAPPSAEVVIPPPATIVRNLRITLTLPLQ
jgi:hypothetical protein